MMKYLFLFFFLIGIVACKERKSEGGAKIRGTVVSEHVRTIPIDVEHPEKIAKLSEVIDSSLISLTPLETTAESVLETVQYFKVYDGCIYIKSERQKAIKVFDESGKYLGELNAKGRGPEEYMYLVDFEIYKDSLIILDFNRLIMYDRHSFQFIRSVDLKEKGIGANNFKCDDHYYYFRSSNIEAIKASTIVCDRNLNLVAVLNEPSYYTKLNFASSPYFIPIGEEMFYYQVMNDTIYKITDDALEAAFILNVGKHSLGYERYINLPVYSKDFPMPIIPKDYVGAINLFYCSDSLLTFLVDYNEDNYVGLFSLKTGNVRLWDMRDIEDDIMNAQTFWYSETTDGEYFYMMIYPRVFLQKDNVPRKEILTKMSEEDNPVLVKYKFRQF